MAASYEDERSALLHAVADLYARGALSEAEMNDRIDRLTAASGLEELKALTTLMPAEALGALALRSSLVEVEAQALRGQSSQVRKKGSWLESRRIEVAGRSSTFRLDLSHYRSEVGISLEMVFDLTSSSVIVTLPRSFRITEAIEDSVSSAVKIRGEADSGAANAILLRGHIKSSFVKFAYR